MNSATNVAATEQTVAMLAYQIYEAEGRPEGRAQEHWRQAEERLRNGRAPETVATASSAESKRHSPQRNSSKKGSNA